MNISSNLSGLDSYRPDSATLFKRTDANGDGKITQDELTAALQQKAQSTSNQRGPSAEDLFSRLDADGDGEITEAEHEGGLQAAPGPDAKPPEENSTSSLVDLLKQLLEAVEKQQGAQASSSSDAAAGARESTSSPTEKTDSAQLDSLIKQLVAELKKNSDQADILRATA